MKSTSGPTVNIWALDISKAFDKVDHFALLRSLQLLDGQTSAMKFYWCIIKLVYKMFFFVYGGAATCLVGSASQLA